MASSSLPAFSGPEPKCIKCHQWGAQTSYKKELAPAGYGRTGAEPEHLLRCCHTCGYTWKEAPLDAKG